MREGIKPKTVVIVARQQVSEIVVAAIDKVSEGFVKAIPMNDMQAAMTVKSRKADYYLGICASGTGKLAMAIAILGKQSCSTVATLQHPPDELSILEEINRGVIAFGFCERHIAATLNILVPALLEEGAEGGLPIEKIL